jgi:hypothetical protein
MMAGGGDPRRASLRVHPSSPSANAASSSSSSERPIFRVFCKGMDEVVGIGDEDPGGGVPVLAVAVCTPQGEVVLRGHKPVLGFVGGHDDDDDDKVLLEAMAIVEGLHTAIKLGIASVKAIIDHRLLHNYVCHCLSQMKCKITVPWQSLILIIRAFFIYVYYYYGDCVIFCCQYIFKFIAFIIIFFEIVLWHFFH